MRKKYRSEEGKKQGWGGKDMERERGKNVRERGNKGELKKKGESEKSG